MSGQSRRPRSGIAEAEPVLGEKDGSRRLRWNRDRQRKEPALFTEWMDQDERDGGTPSANPQPGAVHEKVHRGSVSRSGSGTRGGPTIRAVTPDSRDTGMHYPQYQHASQPGRNVSSSETIHAAVPARLLDSAIATSPYSFAESPTTSNKLQRPSSSRDWQGEVRGTSEFSSRPPGSSLAPAKESDRSRRDKTTSNEPQSTQKRASGAATPVNRLRTRTLDDRRLDHPSPASSAERARYRAGSLHMPGSPKSGDNSAVSDSNSIPARNQSVTSQGSTHTQRAPTGERPMSAEATTALESLVSGIPKNSAIRIANMVPTLRGRMNGNATMRRGARGLWAEFLCSIRPHSHSLVCELHGGTEQPVIRNLTACGLTTDMEENTPILQLADRVTGDEVHLRLSNRADFEAWLAALLFYQPKEVIRAFGMDERSLSDLTLPSPTVQDHSRWPASPIGSDRPVSNASERRSSIAASQMTARENPVIKIGSMVYWSTTHHGEATMVNQAPGQPSTGRPRPSRLQSMSSRRWLKVSGQLRENGQFSLSSTTDNSLITVVQLSQLGRCAIQRLDPTVLENEFSIAIYPQYTASYNEDQPDHVRPIFLTLENRVLHEVWFVLLRAFTMPSIYGPKLGSNEGSFVGGADAAQDLESMIATSTTYTFRMERTLHLRVVEARLTSPVSATGGSDSEVTHMRGRDTKTVDPSGYYADILLDNETRGKTMVKYDGSNPLWAETFDFHDLPPVLNSASIIIKRRPPEGKDNQEARLIHAAYNQPNEEQGGFVAYSFDVTCGKVEVHLDQLEPGKEQEKWWTLFNIYGQKTGDVLIKVRAEEGIILMARDYQPLSQMLSNFSSGLTVQIASLIPGELRRLCDCLLNIFQVSGKATEWLNTLVEDEIDGVHKETPITRLRYNRRIGSNDSNDPFVSGDRQDREIFVRDMNKNATLEANLLFRGNTLLTKSLDIHMRRVGKEYLEETLSVVLQKINRDNPECEVDPNRVEMPQELDRNWRRLLLHTQEVWKAIAAARHRCPVELKLVFRHIRACAEDRYGDFLRSVSYSSVSGFVFLRFFCPAVLNPKLFGLVKDDLQPKARRTFTLIAKSLQTLANMATFGTKEPWMEPMNAFLLQHREGFKAFIDDMCSVPTPISSVAHTAPGLSLTYPADVVSTESHMSYGTPMRIMQRLPPSSREGFPSLPFLIDQPKAFAELINLWLEATAALSNASEPNTLPGRTRADIMNAIKASEGDLLKFHQLCEALNSRTQECLIRAERAERPESASSFQWEDVIEQLRSSSISSSNQDNVPNQQGSRSTNESTSNIVQQNSVSRGVPPTRNLVSSGTDTDNDDDRHATRLFDSTPPGSASPHPFDTPTMPYSRERTGSASMPSSFKPGSNFPPPGSSHGLGSSAFNPDSFRAHRNWSRPTAGASSPVLSATTSTTASAASSIMSSDTEPTALPSWEREMRHREKRERARLRIQQQVAEAASKEKDRKAGSGSGTGSKVGVKFGSALRKKKSEKDAAASASGFAGPARAIGSSSGGGGNGLDFGRDRR